MFITHYNKTPFPGEKNPGKDVVERAGYIPAKIRIEEMILAGQRLRSYRAEQFDFPDGEIDENFTDPTRNLNYDLADATQQGLQVSDRLEEASQTAQEPSSDVLNVPEGYELVKKTDAPE